MSWLIRLGNNENRIDFWAIESNQSWTGEKVRIDLENLIRKWIRCLRLGRTLWNWRKWEHNRRIRDFLSAPIK